MKKWASMLVVLGLAGCGAAPAIEDEVAAQPAPEPLTPLETVLASCPFAQESVLALIEDAEGWRQAGRTFREALDAVNEDVGCVTKRGCRDCAVTALEWIYFGLLP